MTIKPFQHWRFSCQLSTMNQWNISLYNLKNKKQLPAVSFNIFPRHTEAWSGRRYIQFLLASFFSFTAMSYSATILHWCRFFSLAISCFIRKSFSSLSVLRKFTSHRQTPHFLLDTHLQAVQRCLAVVMQYEKTSCRVLPTTQWSQFTPKGLKQTDRSVCWRITNQPAASLVSADHIVRKPESSSPKVNYNSLFGASLTNPSHAEESVLLRHRRLFWCSFIKKIAERLWLKVESPHQFFRPQIIFSFFHVCAVKPKICSRSCCWLCSALKSRRSG